MPRFASERTKPFEQLARSRLDERACPLHVRRAHELVDRGGPERSVDLLVDRGADPALDVRAQLGERVELARRAGELVVDLGQHLLVDVLDRHRRRRSRSRRRARSATFRVSPTRAPTSAGSISSTSWPRAELDDGVGLPSPFAPARSTTSVSPSRAGRSSAGTSSATELRSASSSCWTSSSGTSASARGHLERRPVDDLGRRLHLDGGAERPRLPLAAPGARSRTRASRRGAAATVRPRSRTSRRCATRRPRPRAGRLPTFASSTWRGTFPLRKPGILTDPARSFAACSTACSSSCGETSTVRRTRLPPSSSTWAMSLIQAAWVMLAAGCGLTPERRVSPNGVRLQSDTCSPVAALRSDRPRAWRNWQTRRV